SGFGTYLARRHFAGAAGTRGPRQFNGFHVLLWRCGNSFVLGETPSNAAVAVHRADVLSVSRSLEDYGLRPLPGRASAVQRTRDCPMVDAFNVVFDYAGISHCRLPLDFTALERSSLCLGPNQRPGMA